MTRMIVINPKPSWWHSHRRGYVWMLCTDPLCREPYDLTGQEAGSA